MAAAGSRIGSRPVCRDFPAARVGIAVSAREPGRSILAGMENQSVAAWNAAYRPGVRVSVTKADGCVWWTRTASEALRVGSLNFVELEGSQGLWLLTWCHALEPPSASHGEGQRPA